MAKTLTDVSIRNLKPGSTPREVAVGGARGLYLWIGATGAKSFVVRYRLNGKPKKHTLGRWLPPEDRRERKTDPKVGEPISLAQARKLAADSLLQVGRGHDPAAAKRDDKQAKRQAAADTLAAIATEYLTRICGMKISDQGATFDRAKKRSGAAQHATLVRLVYPHLGDRPITEIKRRDVVRLLDRIEDERGPVMRDRTLGLIRTIMNWHAIRDDDFSSPIVRGMALLKQSDRARSRVLSDDELRAVWKVAGEMPVFGPFVRFLLLTACRRTEASKMTWSEVKDGVWTLPQERNKVAAELMRPLSATALAVLDAQPKIGPHVFSYGHGPLAGYAKPKQALDQQVLKELRRSDAKATLPRFVLHDLRRTARTLMARAGVTSDHAERCLGHVIGGVEGIYDRHRYIAEMRTAYEALARQIEAILNPPAGNVVALHKAAGESD
jgi:integrase